MRRVRNRNTGRIEFLACDIHELYRRVFEAKKGTVLFVFADRIA